VSLFPASPRSEASMSDLSQYTKNQLMDELINRPNFAGVFIFLQRDIRTSVPITPVFDSSELVITKSPPLTRAGVESFLKQGMELIPRLFREQP
jgi:hypothetical protein